MSPVQILVYPNLQQYATQQPCSKPGRYRTSEYQSTTVGSRVGGLATTLAAMLNNMAETDVVAVG